MTNDELQSLIAGFKKQAAAKIRNTLADKPKDAQLLAHYSAGIEDGIYWSMVVVADYLRSKG